MTCWCQYVNEVDPVTAWCFSLRRLTFLESVYVGWRLWRDNVSKYPWPVSRGVDERWCYDCDLDALFCVCDSVTARAVLSL